MPSAESVESHITTTWGDPSRSGADLQPITTPVQWEVMDLRIRAVAPTTPGRHWILIVAGARIETAVAAGARASLAAGSKCDRCWKVLEEVGQTAAHPALCRRCADAVESGLMCRAVA